MKISSIASAWEGALAAACVLVAAAHFAPQGFELAHPVAAAILATVVFVWYRQRLLSAGADEYAKLRMAAFAVQVLWLTLLYDMAAGLLGLPALFLEPLNALLLAVGAASLAAAVLVSLDLALVRSSSRYGRLVFFFAATVIVTQLGAGEPAAAMVPLGLSGLLLGLLAPMGWLITMERKQHVSVLLGGLLAVVPLLAATVMFIDAAPASGAGATPSPSSDVLQIFIGGASLFSLLFGAMLLMRAVQALSGARLYERKVQELDAVYDFGLTTTSAMDPQEFQSAVLRSLQRIGSPDVVALVEPGKEGQVAFSLLRTDAEGDHIYRHQTRGSWPDLSIRFGDRRPLVIADHGRGQQNVLPRIWEPASGSSVIVPVLTPEGSPRALLIAGKHDAHAFKPGEVRSLSGFANQVGLAMEHARLLVEMVGAERRKNELEFARQMQLDLLPQAPPGYRGLDIANRSNPATEVGGDYFDYLDLPNGNLGVVFGDVAGHGMTAGLIMAMAKSAVHTQVRIDGRPDQLLPCLGEVLLEMSVQPGRTLGGAAGRFGVHRAPIAELDPPAEGERQHRHDPGPGWDLAEHPHDRNQPEHAGHQGKREIHRHDPGVVPLPDRLKRGIDHAGAGDRYGGSGGRQQPEGAPDAVRAPEKDPADPEQARRHVGDERHHPLARQPGRAPLTERTPGPIRAAQVQERGHKTQRDQAERQAQPDEPQPRSERQQAEGRAQPEQEQQAVARARGHGEQDDRGGRMHRRPFNP